MKLVGYVIICLTLVTGCSCW